jgi:outer membrane protein TolC
MQGSGRYLPPPKPLDVIAATRTRQEIDFAKPGTTTPNTANAAPSLPADRTQTPTGNLRTPAGRRLASAVPSPDRSFTLKSAPTDPKDFRFRINLATALRLSDARPLVVAAAQAGAWASEAELARAKVLWVPTANIGFDYIRHDGGGPDFNKGIMTAPSVNYFMGGAGADLYINTADAIFEPLAARRMLDSANYDVQAAKNDVLFQTADAYFRVHQYRGMYSGALYTVEKGADLLARVRQLAKELVPRDEIDRAQSMLSDLEQRAASARQEWRVASADLTQILRLDPRAVVVPLEHDHVQITLIDPARDLNELMPIALNNRPELGSRLAIVEAAEIRVRREKMRPALPVVMVDGFQHASMLLQAGIFGIGPNNSLNQFTGRSDVSLQLMWQLEAFGLGNLARVKRQRSEQSRSIIDLRQTQDMIAADVTRALARVQSGAARVQQADRALRTGIITFNGHLEGLEQTRRLGNVLILTFRPQEAVYSLDLLSVAFNEYFTTVAEYNRAQFELFHALGYPAQEIAALRAPGEILPVNTARPGFLPPVGHGPPPATR